MFKILFLSILSIFIMGCGSGGGSEENSTPNNIAPVATDDSSVVIKNSSSYIYPLRNDVDSNNDTLKLINLSKPLHGDIEEFDTYIRYIPDHDFIGKEIIYYRATDGKLNSDMTTITINVIEAQDNKSTPPVGNPDYVTLKTNSRVNIDVLANDLSRGNDLVFKDVTSVKHGSISINQNIIVYQPNRDFIGQDDFCYTPSNGTLDGNVTCVYLTIEGDNEPPVGREDIITINENEPIVIDVLSNDYDSNMDNIFIESVTTPQNGSTYIENNKIKYVPNRDFFGQDSFEYMPHDGKERGENTKVTVYIRDVNYIPIGINDSFSVVTQRDEYLDVLANDRDDNTLSITNLTNAQNGQVSIKNGKVKYISNVGFLGEDRFSYTPSDGTNEGNVTTVTITVLAIKPENHIPIGVDDTLVVSKNSSAIIDVFANDIDEDTLSFFYLTQPLNGMVEILDSGELKYKPNSDFVGKDEFKYIPSDGEATGEETIVRIEVTYTNTIPKGIKDSVEMAQGGTTVIDVLDNDIDDDTLSIASITTPRNGTAIIQDNKIVYTPNVSYIGKDTFSYIPTDNQNNGELTTVDVIVLNPNMLSIKGIASFDRVPVTNQGLDYDSTYSSPIREVLVKLFDNSANEVAQTTTDSNGFYRFDNLEKNALFEVRIYAQMKSLYYEIEVVNNTQNDAKYAMAGELVGLTQDTGRRDFHASSGWDNGYVNPRVAAPFAILDTMYKTLDKLIAVGSDIDFGKLQVNWSPLNKRALGDKSKGHISTSHYDREENLWILGDADRDTDEYDIDVITHEFGHFLKSKISRQDSIGGQHSSTTKLDIRVAYEEGWCNAFAGIIHNKPEFIDTTGYHQQLSSVTDLENNLDSNNGWFSEGSVQRIIYDLFDSENDESDVLSLGFKPIFDISSKVETKYPAFLSIFTFIYGLKNEYPDLASDIDKLVENENISPIVDYFGDERENTLNNAIPIYKTIDLETTKVFCTETTYGISNKILNRVLIKFNIPSKDKYRINIERVYTTTGDPEFNLYQTNPIKLILSANSTGKEESERIKLYSGSYILDLYDHDSASKACFKVEIKEAAFYDIF